MGRGEPGGLKLVLERWTGARWSEMHRERAERAERDRLGVRDGETRTVSAVEVERLEVVAHDRRLGVVAALPRLLEVVWRGGDAVFAAETALRAGGIDRADLPRPPRA